MSRAKRKRKASAARKRSKRIARAMVDAITSPPLMALFNRLIYDRVRAMTAKDAPF